MPDEALISQIENILTEVIELGGANERSQIVPNLTIQDANPSGLTGFIIVSDDRDGDNILAKKVPSVTYTNNDLVNVLFPRGGEAVAFQQGSQSASGDLWEIVPSTSTDIFYDKGKVGIGTDEIPHGGVGWATLAIDGGDFAADGANIQLTTSADDYPTMQIFGGGTHDEVGIFFDSYYDGTNRSSTTDQNFQILATGGRLRFRYDSGVAAGAALSWNEGIALRTDGTVGIGTITPGAQLESVLSTGAQLRLSHTTASKFLDVTVDTNHDATFKPSSTGQIIFQPTTDSTDFLQVLDADGGTPIVNVDSTNERVSIGKTGPNAELDINATLNIGSNLVGFSGVFSFVVNTSTGGLILNRSAAGLEPFVRLTNNTASSGGQLRGLDAGGLLFTNDSGVTQWARITSSGDVGINTTGPDAKLDVLDTSGAQLRLTHTDGSKFVDFTLDTNHDLTITPSSTGQIIFQPTTDQTNFLQVLDADGGTPILNVDATNEQVGIGTATPSTRLDIDAGAMEFAEMTAPGAGAANTARLYAEDNAGTTRQRIKFSSGNAVTIAEDGGLQTYTITNVTTDRAYDANATTVAELADALGTLIADFQAAGILG
jgi:hypothetical protein